MLRFLPFALLAVTGCATAPITGAVGVQEVMRNARALDGREIVVSGWLDRCEALSCGLYASREELGKSFPYYLSVGPSRWLDVYASQAAPARITLRVRFHDRCISDPATTVIAACADRSYTLEPLALIR